MSDGAMDEDKDGVGNTDELKAGTWSWERSDLDFDNYPESKTSPSTLFRLFTRRVMCWGGHLKMERFQIVP
jgi:hypothetical protein